MRVLWTHNWDPAGVNAGTFMKVFAEGMRACGVRLDLRFLGNLRSPLNLLRARAEVARLARGYDLVHGQFGSACALATAAASGVPTLLSLRGSDWYRYRASVNRETVHSVLAVGMSRSVIERFDAVIVMSERMRRDVARLHPSVPLHVIPDPIDLRQFVPMERSAARAAVGLPDDRKHWVLFTTRSTANPVKRVTLAVRAVELVNRSLGGVELRVATGLRHDEMPAFVAGCDVALCTSVHEGWPNSIKEAVACNVPFVATDVSDLREVAAVEPTCRITGDDPEEIATHLSQVLQLPRPSSLRRHVAGMDLEPTSRRLIAIYEDALRAGPGSAHRKRVAAP